MKQQTPKTSALALVTSLAVATLLASAAPAPAADVSTDAASASPAARAFERFKELAGEWHGTDQESNAVSIRYEVVAGQSAVLERFVNSAHGEDNAMLTVYHLDGEELVLTHYCMAGNQPRMRATSLEGDEVRFEFTGATHLASAEAGHMHRAAFHFDGKDRLKTAWTWREGGQDAYTAEIDARRAEGAPRPARAAAEKTGP